MQGYHKKPKQTRWGPRTPGELLNDAYKGREAKRWLDSANAANKKQKEFKIAEENRKRDAKLFKGPLTKDQILGIGKHFKNSLQFTSTPPWNNKPKQKTSVTNKKRFNNLNTTTMEGIPGPTKFKLSSKLPQGKMPGGGEKKKYNWKVKNQGKSNESIRRRLTPSELKAHKKKSGRY